MRIDRKSVAKMYTDGKTAAEILASTSISTTSLYRILKAEGVQLRERLIPVDVDAVRRMHFDDGLSMKEISKRLGIKRIVLGRAMRDAGIRCRNRSEAMLVRMCNEGEEGRQRLTTAAHAAVRGRTLTDEIKAAQANGKRRKKPGCVESIFGEAFAAVGVSVEPEHVVGVYNIDFAIPSLRLAIEIDPGQWHTRPRKAAADAAKDAYLKSIGWTVIRWTGHKIKHSNPGLRDLAEHLVRELKRTRIDPATEREDRVIASEPERSAA